MIFTLVVDWGYLPISLSYILLFKQIIGSNKLQKKKSGKEDKKPSEVEIFVFSLSHFKAISHSIHQPHHTVNRI